MSNTDRNVIEVSVKLCFDWPVLCDESLYHIPSLTSTPGIFFQIKSLLYKREGTPNRYGNMAGGNAKKSAGLWK